jgi:general secretion pathway protein M
MAINRELDVLTKKISGWFHGLGQRDQLALKILGLGLVIFLAYLLIWGPASAYRSAAIRASEQAYADLGWMKENEAQARLLSGQNDAGKVSLGEGQSLLSLVSASARLKSIELQRFEPKGDDKINIWLDRVEFNRMMLWLESMYKETGIKVEQISVDKSDAPGFVTARLSLAL